MRVPEVLVTAGITTLLLTACSPVKDGQVVATAQSPEQSIDLGNITVDFINNNRQGKIHDLTIGVETYEGAGNPTKSASEIMAQDLTHTLQLIDKNAKVKSEDIPLEEKDLNSFFIDTRIGRVQFVTTYLDLVNDNGTSQKTAFLFAKMPDKEWGQVGFNQSNIEFDESGRTTQPYSYSQFLLVDENGISDGFLSMIIPDGEGIDVINFSTEPQGQISFGVDDSLDQISKTQLYQPTQEPIFTPSSNGVSLVSYNKNATISTQLPPVNHPPATAMETATATATPTEAPAEQIDLKPNYEQKVAVEHMGVQINASLITDQSLDPVITKVTVGEKAYAEFLARSLYKVWLKKGGPDGTGPATDTTFEQFMALWATAQQSGQEADWRQVQIKNIWANEIATPGYEQHPYTIWFMHEGETPEDVRGISNLSIALVKTPRMKNITADTDGTYTAGMGINIENGKMYFYAGLSNSHYSAKKTANYMSFFNWFLNKNSDILLSLKGTQGDDELEEILVNGALIQEP